ncbi:hypothetical protein GCM10011446_04170 [Acinetobacter vivianii]|nr:hypothetical protein GCM10011446_04170 [Acinetobacter vivianii]
MNKRSVFYDMSSEEYPLKESWFSLVLPAFSKANCTLSIFLRQKISIAPPEKELTICFISSR